MKMHYRKVTVETNPFTGIGVTSIKIPCGSDVKIIGRSTKEKSKVTCKRCKMILDNKKSS